MTGRRIRNDGELTIDSGLRRNDGKGDRNADYGNHNRSRRYCCRYRRPRPAIRRPGQPGGPPARRPAMAGAVRIAPAGRVG